MGDLHNKTLIDLACGDGFYTRIYANEAHAVVGLDLSASMIKLAKKEEENNPKGITYHVADACNLPPNSVGGPFDLVHASYLLCYAQTQVQLVEMCHSAHNLLKVGGKFIGITMSPMHNHSTSEEYFQKFGYQKFGKSQNGKPQKCALATDATHSKQIEVTNYWWDLKTYNASFKAGGFRDISWHNVKCDPNFPEVKKIIWNEFFTKPLTACYVATK